LEASETEDVKENTSQNEKTLLWVLDWVKNEVRSLENFSHQPIANSVVDEE